MRFTKFVFVIVAVLVAGSFQVSPVAAAPGGSKTAVTVWWVVFNHPESCATSPCGVDDLFIPAVEGSVFNASGALVPANGRVSFVTALYETGLGFADVDPLVSILGGPGLLDSQEAEIHVVVRSHGPAIEGSTRDQITTFLEPGCQDLGGPNVCEDVQSSIHQPGQEMSPVWSFADDGAVTGASSQLIRGDGVVQLILDTRVK